MADNWYVVLELEFDPPLENEQVIAEKIEERSKFWATHFNDFKKGAQYRTWHQNIPQIKKDMIGPANIRKQLAEEACASAYAPIDKLLKTIGRKGNITSDEGERLAKKQKVSIELVKKRANSLGIQWVKGANTDYQAIYDKYYKAKPQNAATYEGMVQMLSTFGAHTLYDFLYLNTTVKNVNKLPCNTLRLRAAEKKKKEFYKTDSVSGTGAKLCSQCDIVFRDDNSKEIYDKYLEFSKRKTILDEAKSISEISGELGAEQGEVILGRLTQVFRDRKLAGEVLTAFCKIEKISYSAGSPYEKNANIKICRCGCLNDISDGRRVCSNCGLELVMKCPICGTENDTNIKVCKCGFRFENIDKAVALCEQAEYAINALEFTVAEAHLNDASRYWPNSGRVASLKQHLAEYEKRVGNEVAKMREAVDNKRYFEAKKRYQSIQKLCSDYSDVSIEEEIEQSIKQAEGLYNQAKVSKSESATLELCAKAYDICSDYPGIRQLMPAPNPVTGVKAQANGSSRTNIISWTAGSDRSIRYVVVRSRDGWVQTLSDGKVIYRGSASSYADRDIEAGIPYYYNVFAERAGIYSKGGSSSCTEIINLFEVKHVTITAADSSLNIVWDIPPNHATAEIYEIHRNKDERHVESSTANSYLITGLVNEESYQYRVSLSYFIAGKKQETKGVIVTGTPTCPPLPIDTLKVRPSQDGQFEALWFKTDIGETRLYGSKSRPPYRAGDIIAIPELEKSMSRLQQQNLSAQVTDRLGKGETGASFRYSGNEILYVAAVVVKAGTAVFGNIARTSIGENVAIKSIRAVNGKINIYLNPPKNATGFVVLHRFDQFPTDIGDVETIRKYIPLKQYQLNSAIVLDTLEERKYYFTVYAEFKQDGEKDYSAGTDYLFDNSAKLNITYSISVNKKLFGESYIVLEFEAERREFVLPDIEVMSAVGNTPMFKASAKLFHEIPSQTVKGSLQIKIPIPKNIPRDTYIKAFFRDDSMRNGNQLRLKHKSNYKIS